MTLPGPGRIIVVEPVEVPEQAPAPLEPPEPVPAPLPEEEPAPA
jgi:hypothetical protein